LQIQENGIQGYLYRRLLGRIADKDVRKLAHPGLVLRRVTPELIEEVLAEPCGIVIDESAGAEDLFNRLSQEVTLVTYEPDGSLRHRPDVRRIMLDSLARDAPLKVRQIHERAAQFYHHQAGPEARAEEIYHRLFLEEDPTELDPLWEPGVEQYLLGAVDEVPQRARSYLASHVGVTRDDLQWDRLEIEEWERLAEERVRQLMGYGKWQEALEVLSERSERTPGSALYLLEAQVLERLERWPEARRAAKDGIYWAADGDPALLLDLLRLSARVDERLGRLLQARQMLARAWALASEPESLQESDSLEIDLLRLEIALGLLRLADVDPPLDGDEVEALQAQATSLFNMVATILPQVNWQLLREAALRLGLNNPSVLRQALQYSEVWELGDVQRERLALALAAWDREISQELDSSPGVLARSFDLSAAGSLEDTWSGFVLEVDPAHLPSVLDWRLGKYPVPRDQAQVLVEVLLAEEPPAPVAAL
jgi:hypothetical protein